MSKTIGKCLIRVMFITGGMGLECKVLKVLTKQPLIHALH